MVEPTSKIKIISGWDSSKDVFLLYKGSEKKKKIKKVSNFEWYFYVIATDSEKIPESLLKKYSDLLVFKRVETAGKYSKVYCNRGVIDTKESEKTGETVLGSESFCKELKLLGITPLEADLSSLKRYVIDNDIGMEGDLNVLFFDIETDDSLGTMLIGRDRILSYSACDMNGKSYFCAEKDEREVLVHFLKLISHYDVICGWNSSHFDLPYIKERLAIHGIKYNWKETPHIDLMQRFIKLFGNIMSILGLPSFSLNDVAMTFLNEGKVKFEGKMIDLYTKHFEKFKEYNINDTVLLYKLNKKLQTVPLMIKETTITGSFIDRFFVGELLDMYILREANRNGYHLPSKPSFSDLKTTEVSKIRGGYVMSPHTGLHEEVRLFDFKSLYPSIIISWNISQESLERKPSLLGEVAFISWLNGRKIEEVTVNEWSVFLKEQKKRLDPENTYFQTSANLFFSKKSCFIRSIIKNLLEERKIYKKELDKYEIGSEEYNNYRAMQEIVKELANSMYGITAERSSRYFDRMISESITLTGQFLNKLAAEEFRNMNCRVLYGDTDSIFVNEMKTEKVDSIEKSINTKIREDLEDLFSLTECVVYLNYEKKFKSLLLLDKKRYAGLLTEMDGKKMDRFFYRGTENIQKGTIQITKKAVEELVKKILSEKKDTVSVRQWVKELRLKVQTEEFKKEDIAITRKISKPSTSYKSVPPHVRLGKKLIEEGKMLEVIKGKKAWGPEIKYIVLDEKNKHHSCLVEDFQGQWDRVYYWNTQIYAPLLRILSAAYPEEDWSNLRIEQRKNPAQLTLF